MVGIYKNAVGFPHRLEITVQICLISTTLSTVREGGHKSLRWGLGRKTSRFWSAKDKSEKDVQS